MLPLFQNSSATFTILSICFSVIVYWASVAVYRLTLHPLAGIPGPKLAALTQLYQTYYSYVNGHSRFYKQVELLHNKYGPVVRITPNEVSLSDPEHYEKIYKQTSKYTKDARFYEAFSAPTAAFTTVSNEVHRIRRGVLNPMFSRKNVLGLEDIVQNVVAKLCVRLEKTFQERKEGNLHCAFRAVSVDAISDYAFNDCFQLMERDDFGGSFYRMVEFIQRPIFFWMQFPLMRKIAFATSKWAALSLRAQAMRDFSNELRVKILRIKERFDANEYEKDSRTSIFRELLNPNAVQGHVVPSVDRMVDDAVIMLIAASDTTGNAMVISSYHIFMNPEICSRLRKELMEAFPDPSATLDFLTLEKLPYLTGIVKEGLRLSFGVVGRLPRVVPPSGAEFNGYTIPPGMIVGMSSWMMHRNPTIFPSPESFDPTRWMHPKQAQYLDKFLVAFGKGNRQCVGMPLAYVELYVTLGTLFHRFPNLKANNIEDKDLVIHDIFSAFMKPDATLLHCHRAT